MDFSSPNNNGQNKPGFPGLPTPPGKPTQGLPKPPSSVGKPLPQPPATTGLPRLPQSPVEQVSPQRVQPTYNPIVEQPQPQQEYQNPNPPLNNNYNFGQEENTNDDFETPTEKKGRGGVKRNSGVRGKTPSRPAKKEQEKKPSAYAGKRKNVILARVVVFGIVGALMLGGIVSFLPKASGLTASDGPLILSKVRENLNVTDFPRTQGEGVALSFTKTYLTYDPATRTERNTALKAFAPDDVITKIDSRPATAKEIAQAQSETATVSEDDTESLELGSGEATSSVQNVTEGPYLVGSEMFKGGNAALITTMTKVNNSNWIYLEIPMYYDDKTGAMSVSGSLTFGSPVTSATVPARENSSNWTNDREVEDAFKSDAANYLKAWTESDTAGLERYLVKDNGKVSATPEAQAGLGGTVKFVAMNSLAVESKEKPEAGAPASATADFQTREAEVTVTMLEPSSNLAYTVTYRLVLKYVNQDWFVEDIKNVSALLDRDQIIQEKATDNSTEEPEEN
jgi:hypothetical protein